MIRNFYRFNFAVFAAILIALVSCFPLLGADGRSEHNAAITKSQIQKTAATQPVKDAVEVQLEQSGLVNLKNMGADFVYDQRYGTTNNFTGSRIYNSERVYLRPATAQKLVDAEKEFNSLGYRIKIWDAYRPYSVQLLLYKKVANDRKYFIANPYSKESSVHNRGAAIDITLVHTDGSAVEMPTDFDTFSYAANINNKNCSKQAVYDRELLASVMNKHGFVGIECEWWHFNDSDIVNDPEKYSIVDVMF
jgi:D-alanyl-D-alanine dipeptidase